MAKNIENHLRKYDAALEAISEYFGQNIDPFRCLVDNIWHKDSNTFLYLEDKEDDWDKAYGGDLAYMVEKPLFTMIVYDNGQGDDVTVVVKNSNMVEDIEEQEG